MTTGSSVNSNPVSNQTYTVTATEGTCTATGTVTVAVVAHLTITVTPINPAVCLGDSITLNAGGAATFVWSSLGTTAMNCLNCPSPDAAPVVATTYKVVGTSGACSDSTTVTVNINSLPNTNITGKGAICSGATDSLFAHAVGNGPFTYAWSGTASVNDTILVNTANTYTLTTTDVNGCSQTATQVVTVNSNPTVTLVGNVITGFGICPGKTDTLVANVTGSGPFIYQWNNGAGIKDTALATTVSTYSVIVTDTHGCVKAAHQAVTANSAPTATITGDVLGGKTICNMNDTLLAHPVGHAPFTYMWNTGGMADSAVVHSPGTYTVTVTDNIGCSAAITANVTANAGAITVTGTNLVVAVGGRDTLTAHGGVSYLWSTGSHVDTTMFSIGAPTTYTVSGVDVNGCHDVVTYFVNVGPLNVPNIVEAQGVTLYPNPAASTINLAFKMTSAEKAAVIQVINVRGEEISNTSTVINDGQVMPIDISSLPQGLYFVKITTDSKTTLMRFIKQ